MINTHITMRKLSSLLLIVASLTFSSCLKDGFDDFEALQHDFTLEGEVNPTFVLPIGHGSATIHDLLTMVQESESYVEVDDRGILTISYSADTLFKIDLEEGSKKKQRGAKDGSEISNVVHHPFDGVQDIDLFNKMEIVDTATFEVDSILVSLDAFVKAFEAYGTRQKVEDFGVRFFFDQLYLDVVGSDNRVYNIIAKQDTVWLDSIFDNQYIQLFNNTDISAAVNKRMKQVRYGGVLNIAITEDFYANSADDFVTDSLQITEIDIDGHIDVRFPISAYIDNLYYEQDIDLKSSIELDNISVDSSAIHLDIDNGLPLALIVSAELRDSNNHYLCNLLNDSLIDGASLKPLDSAHPNGTQVTNQPTVSKIRIGINKNVWDALPKTRRIHFKAGLRTSDNGSHAHVAIRDTDLFGFKLWAYLHPSVSLDFNLTGDDNNNNSNGNNQKGGAQ